MKQTMLTLAAKEFRQIESVVPSRRKSSAAIGRRAYEVVLTYFRRKRAQVVQSPKGVDLSLRFPRSKLVKHYEIKGTEGSELAFGKLKVSGKPSFRQLTKQKIPLLRVLNVYSNNPIIVEMIHGQDYTLIAEPRWRVARVAPTTRSTATRQALRPG